MGVEYRHFLVVNDPLWRPENDTASRVGEVIREWGLATSLKKVVDLSYGQAKTLPIVLETKSAGAGIAYLFDGVNGPAVARIAGPSQYRATEDHRYTMNTLLIVGHDYRIHWSSESIYFELVSPPAATGTPIEPNDDDDPYKIAYEISFPSEFATKPPVVKVKIADHAKGNTAWENYQGFWRGAVVIDFGKDLPAFIEGKHALPERNFLAALEAAFRGPIAEIGEFY